MGRRERNRIVVRPGEILEDDRSVKGLYEGMIRKHIILQAPRCSEERERDVQEMKKYDVKSWLGKKGIIRSMMGNNWKKAVYRSALLIVLLALLALTWIGMPVAHQKNPVPSRFEMLTVENLRLERELTK